MAPSRQILVFGSTGQLARCLRRAAWPEGWRPRFLARAEADLADPAAVAAAIRAGGWDAVINAAAYTAVDRAESDAALAYAVNRDAPGTMAAAAAARGLPLIHLSTDYVFAGDRPGPHEETAPVDPQGVYGASKAAGEAAVRAAGGPHAIIRTSWVYSPFGHNFVKTILRLARDRDRLSIVDDQHGNPTAADDLAAGVIRVLAGLLGGGAPATGTYHFCNQGTTTWYGFACAILDHLAAAGIKVPAVVPITTDQYPTPARRPANSALATGLIGRTFDVVPRPWQPALAECVGELLAGPDPR